MGGFVSALAPAATGAAGGGLGGFVSILKAVTPLISAFGGGASAPTPPAPAPLPAAPAPAPAPAAPEVVTEAAEEPVTDTEAARVRSQKRRAASREAKLLTLSAEEDDSVLLSKSLLGE